MFFQVNLTTGNMKLKVTNFSFYLFRPRLYCIIYIYIYIYIYSYYIYFLDLSCTNQYMDSTKNIPVLSEQEYKKKTWT